MRHNNADEFKHVEDLAFIANVPDDAWYDDQASLVRAMLSHFTVDQWSELEHRCLTLGLVIQERLAYVLGDAELVPEARILLRLTRSQDRQVSLTARESLRAMGFTTVHAAATSAGTLEPALHPVITLCNSTNEILDAIERASVSGT
jgi:hypothetical protein